MAGKSNEERIAMIAITMSNSISVNAGRRCALDIAGSRYKRSARWGHRALPSRHDAVTVIGVSLECDRMHVGAAGSSPRGAKPTRRLKRLEKRLATIGNRSFAPKYRSNYCGWKSLLAKRYC